MMYESWQKYLEHAIIQILLCDIATVHQIQAAQQRIVIYIHLVLGNNRRKSSPH
jgi:hypothetical protein